MSLLSYDELMALVARGVITGVDPDYVNATSIDITLGKKILREDWSGNYQDGFKRISLSKREPLMMTEYDCTEGFLLEPGDFILAQSEQVFNLPNDISCEYKLKSSMARIGINHCLAGWCDAGWNGSVLTLEFMNMTTHHAIEVKAGDKIGQMIFFSHRMVPSDRSYAARGRYNNDKEVKGIKE